MASSNGSSGGVPPGFRFHPTDEELLHYYLKKKISFHKFDMEVIREVDLNKIEPWDLQERCRIGSTPQNEWYFFSHKDRKYPTGSRTNRATNAGFWKATGRDKCIRNTFKKIGMRKTLVFYRGRAPHGQKTDWIMHEYRLEDGDDDPQDNPTEDGWVVCRVFKKKNLFKVVGNDGGNSNMSMTTSSSAALDHQQLMNQARSFTASSQNQYLLLRQHQNHLATQQHNFDLYKPPDLALHHYSHIPTPPFNNNTSHHLHAQAQLIPAHNKGIDYDFPTLPSDTAPLMVRQLMSNPRDCESAGSGYQANCEPGLEVGTCQETVRGDDNLNEWAMLDRLVTSQLDQQDDSSKGVRFDQEANAAPSVHQINHLSLRGEMDFWGYEK